MPVFPDHTEEPHRALHPLRRRRRDVLGIHFSHHLRRPHLPRHGTLWGRLPPPRRRRDVLGTPFPPPPRSPHLPRHGTLGGRLALREPYQPASRKTRHVGH